MAGLLGVDSTIYKTKDSSSLHANNLSNGTYLIKNRSTSDGYPCAWGLIVSMVTGMGAGIQLAFDASVNSSSRTLMYRLQWDTVWGEWSMV